MAEAYPRATRGSWNEFLSSRQHEQRLRFWEASFTCASPALHSSLPPPSLKPFLPYPVPFFYSIHFHHLLPIIFSSSPVHLWLTSTSFIPVFSFPKPSLPYPVQFFFSLLFHHLFHLFCLPVAHLPFIHFFFHPSLKPRLPYPVTPSSCSPSLTFPSLLIIIFPLPQLVPPPFFLPFLLPSSYLFSSSVLISLLLLLLLWL